MQNKTIMAIKALLIINIGEPISDIKHLMHEAAQILYSTGFCDEVEKPVVPGINLKMTIKDRWVYVCFRNKPGKWCCVSVK